MPTRVQLPKRTKTSHKPQALHVWRKVRGLLIGKGPKNVQTWQRRTRRDKHDDV